METSLQKLIFENENNPQIVFKQIVTTVIDSFEHESVRVFLQSIFTDQLLKKILENSDNLENISADENTQKALQLILIKKVDEQELVKEFLKDFTKFKNNLISNCEKIISDFEKDNNFITAVMKYVLLSFGFVISDESNEKFLSFYNRNDRNGYEVVCQGGDWLHAFLLAVEKRDGEEVLKVFQPIKSKSLDEVLGDKNMQKYISKMIKDKWYGDVFLV
jgi:hypothetical protein